MYVQTRMNGKAFTFFFWKFLDIWSLLVFVRPYFFTALATFHTLLLLLAKFFGCELSLASSLDSIALSIDLISFFLVNHSCGTVTGNPVMARSYKSSVIDLPDFRAKFFRKLTVVGNNDNTSTIFSNSGS